MTFLNPAILLGLLAASIPVIIHLLNLKKLKRIEFSTLAFLKELQKSKIRRIKLKQWLLLALRVLTILFLVLAFARPALKGVSIGGVTSAAKTSAVFILDDTFSMSVIDGNGSRFNQAKESMKDILTQLQEGDEAALVLVSEKDNDPKFTSNLAEFKSNIENSAISYATGTIHNSIIKAAQLLSGSDNFNKEIYLFTDFQKGSINKEETLPDLSELLNENVKLYSFDYSGKDVFNLGIDNIEVNTQIFEKNKPVEFNVTVTNYSDRNADNVVVSLFINGERSSQQSVTLGSGESQVLTMEALVKAVGNVDVIAELEDDEIIQDNKRYTNLFIPETIPVIIFADNLQDAKFFKLALTASQNDRLVEITEKNLNQLSSYNLNNYETVVIIGSVGINNYQRLKDYLASGGSLFLMPGSGSDLQSFRELCTQLSLPVPSALAGEESETNSVSFDKIEFQHPVFQNLFTNEQKKQIESPEIYKHFVINSGANGKTIISLMDGSSFLSEYQQNNGKIFLLNTAPVLSWGNFPLKSIFVPLVNKSVFYLSAKEKGVEKYTAGESVDINLSGKGAAQIKIVKPDNSEEFITLADNPQDFVSFSKTDIAGNYKVYSGETLLDNISVNPDPVESITKYDGEEVFADYLDEINFGGNYFAVGENDEPSEIITQARFGSELWKYFVILALVTALIEMAIARNSKKELVGEKT